jgi:uncharacterized protein YqjF (DUF2071 family)
VTGTVRTTTAPGDEQRPSPRSRAWEADVDLENFIMINHAVPAARLTRHLPDRLVLETFESEDGRETSLVTTTCFCNRDLRWRLTRRPTHTFNQVTFRTYVTLGEARGLYFFGTYVDTRSSALVQGALATGTKLARFDLDIRKAAGRYPRYSCTARHRDEVVSFVAEATRDPEAPHPFPSADEYVQWVGLRLHGFSRSRLGLYTHGRVDHRRLSPVAGTLLEGRFDFWERLGILTPDEFLTPQSVLVEPHIRFTLLPPRPIRL